MTANRDNDFSLNIPWSFPNAGRYRFVALSLLVALFLVYSNSFECSWHFDDYRNIISNQNIQIKSLTWSEIHKSLYGISDIEKWSRPLSYLSFALNYYYDGLNPFGYHVVNFVIHWLAAIFLFLFIHNVLQLPILRDHYKSCAYSIALLATFLWAVNPIQVNAVTYIVQRMASMCALFYIMSMYLYLKARTANNLFKSVFFLVFSFFSGILAIGAKENGAMLPVSLFLFDLFLIQGISRESLKRNLKIAALPLLSVLAIGVIYFGNILSQVGDFSDRSFTMAERVLTQPRVILYYITLLLYPITDRLMLIHDFTVSKSLFDPWTTLASILVIVFIITYSLLIARKNPLYSYCILFFFINHFMEGSFISLEIIYEHRNYLPSMLFFLPIAIMIIKGLDYFSGRKKFVFLTIVSAVTAIILIQGITVYIQNTILRDEISLWEDNAKKAPNIHHIHQNLAVAYFYSQRYPEAHMELQKALHSKLTSLTKKRDVTYCLLGEYYQLYGDDENALVQFQNAVMAFPQNAIAYDRMAQIMIRRKAFDEAERLIKKALSFKKNSAALHLTYSFILIRQNHPDEAIQEAQKALMLDPDMRNPYLVFAEAFKLKGRHEIAMHFLNLSDLKELPP